MGISKKANNIYITVRDTYTSISGSSYEEAEEVIIEATNGDLELISQKKVIMQGLGNGKGDDKSKKTQLLITKVEGKDNANPYEEVTYKVTKYNQDKVSENDKKCIQWAIKIDGKQEILKEKGEELKLTIKEEWAEKEVIVMPFLKKAIDKVAVRVKILNKNPLKKHKEYVKHTLAEWAERYKDFKWNEIATEAGWHQGLPLGPNREWRYLINPIDGNVMDMRHVLVVGYGCGEKVGDIVEYSQSLSESTRGSAFDPQDYYSNKVGAYFYQLRHSGKWKSDSWSYDFKRFIETQYKTLFNNYEK